MDYNQQRRPRGGYGCRRPGNPGCGCRPAPMPTPAKPDCGCRPAPAKPDCGHRPAPANPGCGCRPAPAPAPAKPDCGCQSMPVKPDCGCRPMPAPAKPDCGHRPAPSRPDCGCDHMHPSAAGIDSFEIAMAYVPWQRWKGTYDPHRSLMSGTIFPELDKPFCAAGRCSR